MQISQTTLDGVLLIDPVILLDLRGVSVEVYWLYAPADERGIRWTDPGSAIARPTVTPLVSPNGQACRTLAEMDGDPPQWSGTP